MLGLQLVPLFVVVELQEEVRLRLPRPTSWRIGDTELFSDSLILKGSIELTVLFVRICTALSDVTGLGTLGAAALLRLEM